MSFIPEMHAQQRRRYWLRWRFEYGDGKPPKYGMWSNPGPKDDMSTKAWCHNRGVVARAIVEGKNLETKAFEVLAECPGHDFVNFEWMALALVNPFNVKHETTPLTRLRGLKLKTRYKEFQVHEDGRVATVDRSPEDSKIQYATFGR